jgi:hypothetical protein
VPTGQDPARRATDAPAVNSGHLQSATLMARVGLPLSKVPEHLEFWFRTEGRPGEDDAVTFVLMPGVTTDSAGKPRRNPFPYGYYPRRILHELVTIATHTQDRMIPLPPVTTFMRQMGITPSGGRGNGSVPRFREQMEWLLSSSIAIVPFGKRAVAANATVRIASRFQLWRGRDEARPSGFREFVELSEEFFAHILKNHIDLPRELVEALGSHALALDVATWITWCFEYANGPMHFEWLPLQGQFGVQLSTATAQGRHQFRKDMTAAVRVVIAELPASQRKLIKIDPRHGITVTPPPRAVIEGLYSQPQPLELTSGSAFGSPAPDIVDAVLVPATKPEPPAAQEPEPVPEQPPAAAPATTRRRRASATLPAEPATLFDAAEQPAPPDATPKARTRVSRQRRSAPPPAETQ